MPVSKQLLPSSRRQSQLAAGRSPTPSDYITMIPGCQKLRVGVAAITSASTACKRVF